MYLIDTNVISEARKGAKANAGVRTFWRETVIQDVYLAVQTIGELRQGLESIRARGDAAQARLLETWLHMVTSQHAGNILAFDTECAEVWGKLMAANPQHPVDKQIAAIALIHDLVIVTRNTSDFAGTGVKLINPFM